MRRAFDALQKNQFAGLLVLQLIGFWPSLVWYVRRIQDGSDEPYGILALLTIIVAAVSPAATTKSQRSGTYSQQPCARLLRTPLALTAVYLLLFPFLPPLGRAGIAALSIASTVGAVTAGTPFHFGLLGLALLSLPILPTFQFYLGYPLRLVSSYSAAFILQTAGFNAVASGTLLDWNGTLVWFDAPCSGTKMLWGGSFLHLTLSTFGGASRVKTVLIGLITSFVILIGNIVRTVMLFFPEAGIVPKTEGLHETIGLLTFIAVGAVIVKLHSFRPRANSECLNADLGHASGPQFTISIQPMQRVEILKFAALHIAAFAIPLLLPHASTTESGSTAGFTGWPRSIDGAQLSPLPLTEKESGFASDFPGKIARFSSANGEVLLRHISRPSRKLHPAADCLRGSGFKIKPAGAEAATVATGTAAEPYGCMIAIRGDDRLKVCERIVDRDGKVFGDVSQWFWSAALGRSEGPWLAITTASQM